MQGMDPARVREVATVIRGCARDVEDVRTIGQASAAVLAQVWSGGDAEYLLRAWEGLTPALGDAAAALAEASDHLHRQSEDQDRASGEGGGGAASGGVASGGDATSGGGGGAPAGGGALRRAALIKPADDTNPAPREAVADVDPESGPMTKDAAERWHAEHLDGVNPAWDIGEDGTAVVNDRAVPNNDFAGRTYGGPQWSEASAEEHGPQWSEELAQEYPDGVEIDEFGFPLFYPYINPNHPPVLVELTETSSKDIRLAYEAAGIDKDEAKELQEDWVWHHTHAYDPESGLGELILIPRDLHAAVKHAGGRSLHKHNGAETSD